ncbi:hypothetical protein O0I10_004332 [Lichtheimia ornata]|uniref:Uncharacterized protein n=1 Tax=Lichtheimia ornata TaxID=688661 RepID=A0AAD7V5I7_9FUNG|nr:uncharacterized protein O0I10_004332 [Lichtheimia ornata]KAJ8659739.1 hypothetical protein O0I10_004332 [Lichtheimia ornata]
MSALEGDAVINTSSAVDLFKPSKQVTSTRSPPKLLRGMAMHKAMQHVYGLPSPSEALNMLDLYDQDTEVPDAIPDTPELRETAEDEGTDASEQQVQELEDIPMASPLPSPPSFPLPLPPPPSPPPQQQQQPILYTQVMPQPTITIHPEVTPEVVVAAVVAAASSSAPAASAIPVASSTGSSNNNNRSRLQFRRPVIRPRSRLRWQRPSRRQPPPLPRPPPSPPRPPPSPSISPPPSSPPSPASTSSSIGYEYRPIACPRRRLPRPETTTTTSSPIPSSSSSPIPSLSSLSPILPLEASLSPILPMASSSSTLLFTEAELASPSPILSEDAAQADSFMGGDDILAEIMGTDLIDPFDEVVFNEDA